MSNKRYLGKKRNKDRKAATRAVVIEALKSAGANCGNCSNFSTYPSNPGVMICELGSDFYGYQIAKADGICESWTQPLKERLR